MKEDLMNERYKHIIKKLKQYSENDYNFKSYISNIVKNLPDPKFEEGYIWKETVGGTHYLYEDGTLIYRPINGKGVIKYSKMLKGGYEYYYVNNRHFSIHRELCKAFKPLPEGYATDEGLVVDHIDGNPRNNKLDNLRWCTQSQNLQNKRSKSNTTSKYKGVYVSLTGRASFEIVIKGVRIRKSLGRNEERAAMYYDICALYFYKEFAKTNRDKGLYNPELVERFGRLYLKNKV